MKTSQHSLFLIILMTPTLASAFSARPILEPYYQGEELERKLESYKKISDIREAEAKALLEVVDLTPIGDIKEASSIKNKIDTLKEVLKSGIEAGPFPDPAIVEAALIHKKSGELAYGILYTVLSNDMNEDDVKWRVVPILKILKKYGVDLNEPLFYLPPGNPKLNLLKVRALIAAGADINAFGVRGLKPLTWAARHGDIPTAEVLIKAGADINGLAPEKHLDSNYLMAETPLIAAATQGNTDMVNMLIAAGANKDVQDWVGMTALARAITNGHRTTALALIAAGADVNKPAFRMSKNDPVLTPLVLARDRRQKEVIDALIKAGAR